MTRVKRPIHDFLCHRKFAEFMMHLTVKSFTNFNTNFNAISLVIKEFQRERERGYYTSLTALVFCVACNILQWSNQQIFTVAKIQHAATENDTMVIRTLVVLKRNLTKPNWINRAHISWRRVPCFRHGRCDGFTPKRKKRSWMIEFLLERKLIRECLWEIKLLKIDLLSTSFEVGKLNLINYQHSEELKMNHQLRGHAR